MTESPRPPVLPPPAERLGRAASRGVRMLLTGVAINTLLAAVKIFAGLLGHANALVADGVESMTDVVSSLIVSGGLRIAGLPPDRNHPYGHGKAESVSALIVSVALLATAGGIALESVQEILHPTQTPPEAYTLAVLAVVIVVKEWLYRSHSRGSDEIGSSALEADAWHHRCDAIASAAALIGIAIAILGGLRFYVADSWAALAVCLVIAATGVHLLRRNLEDVMDTAAPPEVEARIRAVAAAVPEVAAVEKCRVRRSGLSLLVDIHIEVDGQLSVRHGHAIAHDVQQALLDAQLSILDVAVHVEPAGGV